MIYNLAYLFVDGLLLWVIHDGRGLDWEVGHILVLVTVSHVELAPLALPEIGEGTWPDG